LQTVQLDLITCEPGAARLRFEYWRSAMDRRWYWHLRTDQNEKLAQGEAYATQAECLRAIAQVQQSGLAPITDLSPRER
jgi:uncharacterized protein YegP (UPF0339 family)